MANHVTQKQAQDYALEHMTSLGYEGLEAKTAYQTDMSLGKGEPLLVWQLVIQYEKDQEIHTAHWDVWRKEDGEVYGEW